MSSVEMKTESLRVPLVGLCEEPFASILCYPKPSKVELEKRLRELEKLGVAALEFCGEKQVSNMKVLGKGCVGIVVKAWMKKAKRWPLKSDGLMLTVP